MRATKRYAIMSRMENTDMISGTILIFVIGVGLGYYIAKLVFGV